MNPDSKQTYDRIAGIILAGGKSLRMGTEKALLEWHGGTQLYHTINALRFVIEPIVVVAQIDQQLPALPPEVNRVHDAVANEGPLRGLQAGLRALSPNRPVFVTGCDYPFVGNLSISRMATFLNGYDVVVPRLDGHPHPLVALYRPEVLSKVEETLANGKRSLLALLDVLNVCWLNENQWRELDPNGKAHWNVNTPEEYARALQEISAQA